MSGASNPTVLVTAPRISVPRGQDNDPVLIVNGKTYSGWHAMTFERAIDRIVSTATLTLYVNPQLQVQPWPIDRWMPARLRIGADTVLVGYIEQVQTQFSEHRHTMTISVCSNTQDLVDCSPDMPSGQFRGYTLAANCTAICQPFGIEVVTNGHTGQVFPNATLQRGETAFSFMECFARLSGVLLTDDQFGRVVLTQAGTSRAATQLAQGMNILAAGAKMSADKRYSVYIVTGQLTLGSTQPSNALAGDATTPVQTALVARATDATVPRYRPHISMAESQLDQAGMQMRANWECNYAIGRSTEAEITVQGFRQTPAGALWWDNLLTTVNAPYLQVQQDLLLAKISMTLSPESGRLTKLTLGPIEGYTPSPGQVKIHAKHARAGASPDWNADGGAGGITSGIIRA